MKPDENHTATTTLPLQLPLHYHYHYPTTTTTTATTTATATATTTTTTTTTNSTATATATATFPKIITYKSRWVGFSPLSVAVHEWAVSTSSRGRKIIILFITKPIFFYKKKGDSSNRAKQKK